MLDTFAPCLGHRWLARLLDHEFIMSSQGLIMLKVMVVASSLQGAYALIVAVQTASQPLE